MTCTGPLKFTGNVARVPFSHGTAVGSTMDAVSESVVPQEVVNGRTYDRHWLELAAHGRWLASMVVSPQRKRVVCTYTILRRRIVETFAQKRRVNGFMSSRKQSNSNSKSD